MKIQKSLPVRVHNKNIHFCDQHEDEEEDKK